MPQKRPVPASKRQRVSLPFSRVRSHSGRGSATGTLGVGWAAFVEGRSKEHCGALPRAKKRREGEGEHAKGASVPAPLVAGPPEREVPHRGL